MTDPRILAALSEGICPLCVPPSRLDDNRVCRAGVQWDIHRGIELGRPRPPSIPCADPIIDCDFSEVEARLVGQQIRLRREASGSYGIPQIVSGPAKLYMGDGTELGYTEKPIEVEFRTEQRPPTDRFGINYVLGKIKDIYGG